MFTHCPSTTGSFSILPLTSAEISTFVLGWIFPVALTRCTILARLTLAVCTTGTLPPRPLRAIPVTTATSTTMPAMTRMVLFFLAPPTLLLMAQRPPFS